LSNLTVDLKMTISNSNVLSILSTGTDVSIDGLMTGQLSEQTAGQTLLQPVDAAAFDKAFAEGDFWSMLNQQLIESSENKTFKGFENKDLSSFLYDLGVGFDELSKGSGQDIELSLSSLFNADVNQEPDVTEHENNLTSDLMHSMKSHFLESEISQIQPETLEETPVPFAIPINVLDKTVDAKQFNGDKLPSSRQTVSAILPAQTVALDAESAVKSANIPVDNQLKSSFLPGDLTRSNQNSPLSSSSVPVNVEAQDVEIDEKLLNTRNSEFEMQKPEMRENEKFQLKQVAVEQLGSVVKDTAAPVLSPVHPLSSTAVQNPINQPPGSTLQTLQLSSQATASQWGDALGEKVSLLINNKLNSAEIRIDPPHLGKLDIQIQLKDDSATISINTHNAQTRELIDSASVRLREFLQEAGYSSVDVNVSHREQSMAQGDLSDQDQQSDSNDQQQSSDQSELAAAHQAELSLMIDDGRIDYFA